MNDKTKLCDKSDNDFSIQNEFLAKIQLVVQTLNEIDDIMSRTSEEQSKADSLRSDYLHLYEDYDLSSDAMVEISKKLHDVSVLRRNWNNVFTIGKTYREHIAKLQYSNQREFFCAQIANTVKHLNVDYKDRILTEREKTTLLNVNSPVTLKIDIPPYKKSPRGGYKLSEKEINEIVEEINNKMSIKDIAEKHNTCAANIYRIRKEYTNYEKRKYNKHD